ncbi:MAG TPA: aminotransferase class III-fold pyridoxal phosphate-dependent enzyme [Bacteroidales bacterium]|nr:aminotransferase class III-fold pyridoxal phosphate-dependent enzyme [Bacteroidales bacterium]
MSLELTPGFRLKDAERLALEEFGLTAEASLLPGERDQNFLLETDQAEKFVLKIANASEELNFLEAQNQVIQLISKENNLAPEIIPSCSGDLITRIKGESGSLFFIRMLRYLEGSPMGKIGFHSETLLRDLGRKMGQFDKSLFTYDNSAFHRDFNWDLAKYPDTIKKYSHLVEEPDLNEFIDKTTSDFYDIVAPIADKIRKSIIHNDANDYNIIIDNTDYQLSNEPVIRGFIDYGDMLYSYTAADLAVTVAYAILKKPDPLETAMKIAEGYNENFKLLPEEISSLFTLARMRLCISICMSASQRLQRPDDKYLIISQRPIRDAIPRLNTIAPRFAEAAFRKACGLDAGINITPFRDYLTSATGMAFPVLGEIFVQNNCTVLDLSVGSPIISGNPESNTEEHLTSRIIGELRKRNVRFGIGRYNEPRILYTSPNFTNADFSGKEDRTIHMGIDIFTPAGTSVYSPLDATVHSFSIKPEPLDYGHVIILKHSIDSGLEFYTLYGHLSRDSIKNMEVGSFIKRGEEFALTGYPSENGGWTPHLHFQVITDLLGLGCDFPGVSSPAQRELWMDFSPDPNLILAIPGTCFPGKGTEKGETLRKRGELIGRNLILGYKKPLMVSRGWMQYLYDENGQKYLDGYNNVPHIGHSHPEIADRAAQQMSILNTNTRYLHDSLTDYAELLTSTLPSPLKVCYFVNSASEANELALRLAFGYTGSRDMIVLEGAYHGHTTSLIDISPYKHNGPGGCGSPSWVHTAPIADCYRGKYKYSDREAGPAYADFIGEIISGMKKKKRGLAGFIAETCPSVGGQIIFPSGYLKNVYRYIREDGGICIADEVQTGYGRMGTGFYAFEDQEVIPDIVILGKPIGNGFPIGAVITTPDIAGRFDNGMEFFSTFGGSTLSCIVGKAVLEIVLRDNLQKHAREVGDYMRNRLMAFKDKFDLVGDVRGSGLFLGIELIRDHETLEPASEEAGWVCNRMRENNILIGTDGPYHNVIKIRPPMPFSIGDSDHLIDNLERLFESMPGFKT